MEGASMILFLSITMFLGSFLAGLVPLALALSESKMRHITILGAGLLIGTALAVIIPEGILAIYSSGGAAIAENHLNHNEHHIHKRGLNMEDLQKLQMFNYQRGHNINENQVIHNSRFRRQAPSYRTRYTDNESYNLFLNQMSHNINQNQVIDSNYDSSKARYKRETVYDDETAKRIFSYQLSKNNNVNQVLDSNYDSSKARYKRNTVYDDETAKKIFLYQLSKNNNVNQVIDTRKKRDLNDQQANPTLMSSLSDDVLAKRLFLYQVGHNINENTVIDSSVINGYKRFKRYLEEVNSKRYDDETALKLFNYQRAHNINQNQVIDSFRRFKRDLETDQSRAYDDETALKLFNYQRGHNINQNQVIDSFKRFKRYLKSVDSTRKYDDETALKLFNYQRGHNINQNQVIDDMPHRVKREAENKEVKANNEKSSEKVNPKPIHTGENALKNAHSAIGITLVLGFVFMLIIDQIGGGMTHRPVQGLDAQSLRSKKTFVTTLGLVVHAAADGIALGAAASTSKTDVEMIVFAAIMLHKAPAAFGLVSFLIHEGLDRSRVRKHLTIFALAAPVVGMLTYFILKSGDSTMVSSDSTGLCMLFSAGTFLYVSTVHVLPEVQSHNEDRQFRLGEMFSFIVGALLPLFLSMGHSH